MFDDKLGWNLKVRVWIERRGRRILGPGRAELLGHIDRHGSITAAAKLMKMSYKRAWKLVRDINEAAGEPLVDVTTGGPGGGGAALTARGKEAVALYQRIADKIARVAAETAAPPARK
jgi:molybdate transport system regulatory protein